MKLVILNNSSHKINHRYSSPQKHSLRHLTARIPGKDNDPIKGGAVLARQDTSLGHRTVQTCATWLGGWALAGLLEV